MISPGVYNLREIEPDHRKRNQRTDNCGKRVTSSFIQTILLVLELHQIMCRSTRGLYRQSGIAPCPEDNNYSVLFERTHCTTFYSVCKAKIPVFYKTIS